MFIMISRQLDLYSFLLYQYFPKSATKNPISGRPSFLNFHKQYQEQNKFFSWNALSGRIRVQNPAIAYTLSYQNVPASLLYPE